MSGGNYTIYPTPQKVTDEEGTITLTDTINVIQGEGIDTVTANRIKEVLTDNGYTTQVADQASETNTNLYVGIYGSGDAADTYEGVPKDVFTEGENKYDMHVVKVFENGDIVILGKDSDAAYYGLATLNLMLEQTTDRQMKISTFEDYSFQKYRGCVEGYYGYPWSVEGTLSWFDFAKRYKMNIFLYGPKTDPYHLGQWDEPYPETVTEESLRGFRAAGVNRISFGVQSARDTQLRTLGRPHSAKQARAAFAAARRAGFENISGDIMLALPHYTQAEFDETLELIEKGGATHISAYLLKIEPDSAFGKHPPEGLPTGDEAADFYLYAVEQLEHHGYRQYEISNFAKPGYEGRHNLIYWDCGDYLGLGPAAHSCMGGKRFCYAPDTAAFLQDAAAPIMDGSCGAEDYLILQLRLRKGLDLEAYKTLYGKQFSTAQLAFVQNCVRAGYATFDGRILALTPAGLIVQNSILAQLL